MLETVKEHTKMLFLNAKWRRLNKYNDTHVNSCFPIANLTVGKKTYGPLNFMWFDKTAYVKIGNYCSIGPEVKFMVGGEHNYKRISTYPFQTLIYSEKLKHKVNNNIIVEDDVWLGYDCLIMGGVKIGRGSVIAARAIVTNDVPPYSIFVGNRVLKKRFDFEIENAVKNIDYSLLNHKSGDDYNRYCQEELTIENVEEILNAFIKGD